MFFCEFSEIFKSTFFTEQLRTTASASNLFFEDSDQVIFQTRLIGPGISLIFITTLALSKTKTKLLKFYKMRAFKSLHIKW